MKPKFVLTKNVKGFINLIHNLKNPDDKKELLEPETVELLTTPYEIAGFKEAIMDCLMKGTKREVESEPEKNA